MIQSSLYGGARTLSLVATVAETMYNLRELEHEKGELDLDGMMRRLKDLSAYSLTDAEIMEQREGVELLPLAMFFGAGSNPQFHRDQVRLRSLSQETTHCQRPSRRHRGGDDKNTGRRGWGGTGRPQTDTTKVTLDGINSWKNGHQIGKTRRDKRT
jgi:hypothetical protein